jgi:hypothetical protein
MTAAGPVHPNALPWYAQADMPNGEPRRCLNQRRIDPSEELVR